MRVQTPTLVIDIDSTSAAAVVVAGEPRLVPDPVTGAGRWQRSLHGDDPGAEGPTPILAAMRREGQRHCGPVGRAVVTIPASLPVADPRRRELVTAAEAAGFTAVELLIAPAGAVWAPGSAVRVGDVVLVCDLGESVEASVIRVGDDLPEILGHGSIVDLGDPLPEGDENSRLPELFAACCQDLLSRAPLGGDPVDRVLLVGNAARTQAVVAALSRGLAITVATPDEPELAVVRGAARWLARSGPRTVVARPSHRPMVPLAFSIPGGSGQLLRWLVEPEQTYGAGTALARVRLTGGAIWDLSARSGGMLAEVLVERGRPIASGEWLAFVLPR